jgi:hypothetical protein
METRYVIVKTKAWCVEEHRERNVILTYEVTSLRAGWERWFLVRQDWAN